MIATAFVWQERIPTMTASQDMSALRLSAELRNKRELAQRTQKQVAHAMDWSASKVIRIEAGAVGISTTDLRALLAYYQIEDEKQTEELVELARVVRANRSSHNRNVDAERGFSRPD
jgi:transcriptional regulator with XRE-family HTH domain